MLGSVNVRGPRAFLRNDVRVPRQMQAQKLEAQESSTRRVVRGHMETLLYGESDRGQPADTDGDFRNLIHRQIHHRQPRHVQSVHAKGSISRTRSMRNVSICSGST